MGRRSGWAPLSVPLVLARRRHAASFATLILFLLAVASTRSASADPEVEREAKELQRSAIQDDNLNVAYAEAIRKLSTALNLCKVNLCAPMLHAEILRDLGAMHALEGSVEEGRSYFERSIALDPGLSLDRSYSTPPLLKLWADVQRDVGASAAAGAGAQSGTTDGGDGDQAPDSAAPGKSAEHEDKAAAPQPQSRRFWIGVWGSIDFTFLPTADQACLLQSTGAPANTVGYYCTDAQGSDFPSRSDNGLQNGTLNRSPQFGDSLNGGGVLGNVRLGLSFDYALGDNILLGVRSGLVLRTYPGHAAQSYGNGFPAPIHVEARATYLIGSQALRNRFAPLLFVEAGVGEYDAAMPIQVLIDKAGGAGQKVNVNAWAVGGPAFVGGGGGLRVLLQPSVALMVAGKFTESFGAKTPPLPTLGPEASLAYGF